MSSGKNILIPFLIITDGDMSDEIISLVTDVTKIDNIAIQLIWTGDAEGQFFVEGSLNYVKAESGNKLANPGTWVPIDLPEAALAEGTGDTILLDLNQLSFPNIRVRYAETSGTGTVNAYISGKGV